MATLVAPDGGYTDGLHADPWIETCELAVRLGVSPQYVSRLLSGTENLSFKSIANIEDKLGITCITMVNV